MQTKRNDKKCQDYLWENPDGKTSVDIHHFGRVEPGNKNQEIFLLLTIDCQIWMPPYKQQGTSGSSWKDCQHCADLWSQKCKCLQLPLCSQYSDFPGYFVVDITIFLWSQIIHFCIFWNYVAKMASNNTSLPEIKFSCVYRLQKSLQNKCWCEQKVFEPPLQGQHPGRAVLPPSPFGEEWWILCHFSSFVVFIKIKL